MFTDFKTFIAKKICHGLVVLFLLAVSVFALNRARSDYRWSAWAIGDAQNLNAALHFSQEGFFKHYFLTYYHPGYLGQNHGTETTLGYYTHYPPLSAVINGLVAKYLGDSQFNFKMVAIVFSLLGLLFWYLIISSVLNCEIGLLSTVLIGVSPGFLQFVDCVSPYGYSEFFLCAGLLAFILSKREVGFKNVLLVGTAWICFFLESLNSFDYILFMLIFAAGYTFLFREEDKKIVSVVLFILTAPFAGFGLHLIQNSFVLGGIGGAIADLLKISQDRLAYPSSNFLLNYKNLFLNTDMWLEIHYGLSWLKALMLWGCSFCLVLWAEPVVLSRRFFKLTSLLFISVITWWMVGVVAAGAFCLQMTRQIYPMVSLLTASILVIGLRFVFSSGRGFIKRGVVVLLMCLGLKNISQYTKDYYFKEYPNWINNFRFWTIATPQAQLIDCINISKEIRNHTSFGDIVLVPDLFVWMTTNHQISPIYEYYSQRRMEYLGQDNNQMDEKKEELGRYVKETLPLLLGKKMEIKVYALVQNGNDRFHRGLIQSNPNCTRLEGPWRLVQLKRFFE